MANDKDIFTGTSTGNEWNDGWDEDWDQESPLENKNKADFISEVEELEQNKNAPSSSLAVLITENELERALENKPEVDISQELNWGIIDDIKPTNLASRLRLFINAPFSAVLEPKKQKPLETPIPAPTSEIIDEIQINERPKIILHTPKIHSDLGDSPRQSNRLVIEESDLAFHNLNNISRKELNDVNRLLEGSLGKLDKVKFDNEVVQENNINFVAHEKVLNKKKLTDAEIAKEKEREKEISISSEQTIASESLPSDTLVPGLNDIRFDLKSAQEASKLFNQQEINEALGRIPIEKARILKEKANLGDQKQYQVQEMKKVGEAVFGVEGNAEKETENLSTTDDLLDSLLDEIDGEIGENSFANKDLTESEIESLGKDEIITEKNIVDDSAEKAMEFMDSAAQEAESLFEDFFKQGTDPKDAVVEVKLGYKDIALLKLQDLKKAYHLTIRFIKDPKYFLAYYNITVKDIYVTIGLIFCFLTYTGFIHIRFITEKFPMNLF